VRKTWLSYVNLSDPYERKARFLPAMVSVFPLLPLAAAFGAPFLEWVKLVGLGVGLGAIVAVAVSHVASAFGNRLQERLWRDWPHDSPTNRRLHPDDKTVSSQQRQRWYRAIKEVVRLDIQSAVKGGNAAELKAVINDAVQALRNRLWQAPVAERIRLHNVDYGFARNLAGLWPVWGFFALSSLVGCWTAYFLQGRPLIWAVVSTFIVLGAVCLAVVLPGYVRKKADYYAESFFEAVVMTTEAAARPTNPGA